MWDEQYSVKVKIFVTSFVLLHLSCTSVTRRTFGVSDSMGWRKYRVLKKIEGTVILSLISKATQPGVIKKNQNALNKWIRKVVCKWLDFRSNLCCPLPFSHYAVLHSSHHQQCKRETCLPLRNLKAFFPSSDGFFTFSLLNFIFKYLIIL